MTAERWWLRRHRRHGQVVQRGLRRSGATLACPCGETRPVERPGSAAETCDLCIHPGCVRARARALRTALRG